MNRSDALDAFIAVLNTAKPDHPYFDSPYPVSRNEVEFGATRSYLAKCGPRDGPNKAYYATRMSFVEGVTRERHLAVLTHEVTHVTVCNGVGNEHGGHPPEFWREMTFHALEIRDAIEAGVLEPIFGSIDVADYLQEVAEDPNSSTVDRRYWSVEECRAEMRRLLGHD